MYNYKGIVIFFGAGFSYDLELPIMRSFKKYSDEEYEAILKEKQKQAFGFLKQAGYVFNKFQEYCSKVNRFIHFDSDNMEDIFCLADIIRETSNNEDICIPELDSSIDEIIKQIRIWLWKIYQQCPPMNKRKLKAQKNKHNYNNFFKFLREKQKEEENISIVTTNYDLIPEFFINEIKGKCTYNIPYGKYNEWKIDKTSTENFVSVTMPKGEDKAIPIYKLHGSVNYFFDNKANSNVVNIVVDKLNVKRIGNSANPEFINRPSLFPLDSIKVLEKLNNGQLPIPAIIPPMYSKIKRMEWLKTIWHNALLAIRNAKIIVFIGYSFPQSDSFMKSFFQSAFLGRKDQQPPIIINLDKNPCIKNTYCKIFKNINDENFITGSFSEKYNELMELIDIRIKETKGVTLMKKRWYYKGPHGLIKSQLEDLKQYIETIEHLLEAKYDKFNNMLEKKIEKLEDEEEKEFFYDYYSENFWCLKDFFPNILRTSFFVKCYSILEVELNNICKSLQKQNNYTLSVSDLKGKGIERAQLYCKKVVCMDFPDQSKAWQEIKIYNILRNIIVHREGLVSGHKRSEEIEDYVKKTSGISIEDGYILLETGFILNVIKNIESFFDEFFDSLERKRIKY